MSMTAKQRRSQNPPPVRKTMCETCPFRPGSKYADLAPTLTEEATRNSNRICHQTGSNAIKAVTGKPSHICRGARQVQLAHFKKIGFLPAPTDEEWNKARVRVGMPAEEIKDP